MTSLNAALTAGRRRFRRPLTVLLLGLFATAGCGAGDPEGRLAVTGTVTLDGQPVMDGAVLFEPPSPDQSGFAVGTTIRRGSFSIAQRQGPTPGNYRVRIYARSDSQAPPASGQTERTRRPMAERVPAAYNTRSTLLVEVTRGGSNHFRFDLHADAGG